MKHLLLIAILPLGLAHAEDVLFMRSGEKRTGVLQEVDAKQFRLQVPLPALPGASGPAAFASVSIPRADVESITFAPDPALDQLLSSPQPTNVPELQARWTKSLPWLSIPRSPAAKIGNTLGDVLLRANDPAKAAAALALFNQIESAAWDDTDKMVAKQGRLRAMVATGNAKDAIHEAMELASVTENPVVLIEAKYILATAAESDLRKLLADNPRWEEDLNVIPERHRLYNESLDLYLYPYLFYGSETEPAARGLWGALQIYDFVGEKSQALECARDLTTIYPGTKFASLATDYIASLPKALRESDPEKEAREENAPQPSPTKAPEKKKPNEKPNAPKK